MNKNLGIIILLMLLIPIKLKTLNRSERVIYIEIVDNNGKLEVEIKAKKNL